MARAWPAFHDSMTRKVVMPLCIRNLEAIGPKLAPQSLVILVILCLLFHFQLMASVWQLVSPALEKPVLVLFVYLARVRRTPGPR